MSAPVRVEDLEHAMDAFFASLESTHLEVRARHARLNAGDLERYFHLVEEAVHPFQTLCGLELNRPPRGPRPSAICPDCLERYEAIGDPKEIVE